MDDSILTYPNPANRYREFRDLVFRETEVGEDSATRSQSGPIPELEVQARWFGGEFGRKFTSTDGVPVEIVQFGHWNHGPGPDFTETAVKIGDEIHTGAIELDLAVESWEDHGHGSNPEFNNVVLHVFLKGDINDRKFFTRTENHKAIPQIQISLEQLADSNPAPMSLPEAKLGRCASPLGSMSEENLNSLLMAAAQFRLQQKAQRFQRIATTHSREQMLFQSIAEALGFRHNKVVMAVLAQRLPLSKLRNRPSIEREALIFGAGGFIDLNQFETADDPDSKTYLKELWDQWWKLRSDFEPESDRVLSWKLAATRPLNHPQRRLGALAGLLDSWPTFVAGATDFDSPDWSTRTRDFFSQIDHPFWKTHYTLKSKPSPKPLVLIGKDRARDILGNILFPLAIHENPDLNWNSYAKLPGADSNESLRRAVLRLFGEDSKRGKSFSSRYHQQQALLQIYRDFCLEDASDCETCPFPEQLAQWE